jgi:HK97 family phage major capsid protein
MNELNQVQAEIKQIEQAIVPLLTKQSEEIKAQGETSKQTRDSIAKLEQRYDAQIKELDSLRQELGNIKNDLGEQKVRGRKGFEGPAHRFLNSEGYKGLTGSLERVHPVEVGSFHRKALFTDSALGQVDAYTYPTSRIWDYVTEPERELHIRDLLPVGRAPSASVDYVVRTGNRWFAGIQATEGDLKQEQTLTLEVKQATPTTIANYLPITKQALRNSAQLQAYIENELVYGIKLAEDEALLYGDGSPGNLMGLMTNPNVQDYNLSGKAQSGDTRLDTLRRSITLLRTLYFRPTGVVLNPSDWESIELEKDSDNRYLWVTVPDGGVSRLWRVPVIETPAINQDEFLVGDWNVGAHLWDVNEATIEVGYVNDDFVRNRLVLLAEEDIMFTTELPRGFVRGDFGEVS